MIATSDSSLACGQCRPKAGQPPSNYDCVMMAGIGYCGGHALTSRDVWQPGSNISFDELVSSDDMNQVEQQGCLMYVHLVEHPIEDIFDRHCRDQQANDLREDLDDIRSDPSHD